MRGVSRSEVAIERTVAGDVSVSRFRAIRACRVSSGTTLAIWPRFSHRLDRRDAQYHWCASQNLVFGERILVLTIDGGDGGLRRRRESNPRSEGFAVLRLAARWHPPSSVACSE